MFFLCAGRKFVYGGSTSRLLAGERDSYQLCTPFVRCVRLRQHQDLRFHRRQSCVWNGAPCDLGAESQLRKKLHDSCCDLSGSGRTFHGSRVAWDCCGAGKAQLSKVASCKLELNAASTATCAASRCGTDGRRDMVTGHGLRVVSEAVQLDLDPYRPLAPALCHRHMDPVAVKPRAFTQRLFTASIFAGH